MEKNYACFFSEYIFVSIGSLAGSVVLSLVVFYSMQLITKYLRSKYCQSNANKKMREKVSIHQL